MAAAWSGFRATGGHLVNRTRIAGLVVLMFVAVGVTLSSGDAVFGQKKKKLKFDPEIRAVQTELNQALRRVDSALAEEVIGEKGKLDVKSIEELRKCRAAILTAIKHAARAQKLDRNP